MLGDHIRALKDGRWLHGIDLGDQRVLYLAEAPGLAQADRLRRVYRPEFTAGATRVELVVHREPAYPAKAVVARAWSRFMDPSVVAMFRDSEAFAAWCKIGRLPEAAQVAPSVVPPGAARPAAAPASKGEPGKAAPAARKAPAKAKGAPKRPAKAATRKAAARPAAGRKAAPRKAAAAKAAAKQAARRPAPGKKGPAKRAPARKPAGKKKGRR